MVDWCHFGSNLKRTLVPHPYTRDHLPAVWLLNIYASLDTASGGVDIGAEHSRALLYLSQLAVHIFWYAYKKV